MKTFAITVTLLMCAMWATVCSAGQPVAPLTDVPVI